VGVDFELLRNSLTFECRNPQLPQPKSTGLTDAITWSKEKLIDFYGWAKVEVPKALDSAQKKIDELQK